MNTKFVLYVPRRIFVLVVFVVSSASFLKVHGSTISYSYDSLHRITAVNTGNGCVINYTYDASGNRLTYSATAVVLPVISTQPLACSVSVGGSATFSVTASGNGTLSYQWKRNGSPVGGATAANFALTGINAAQAGNYTVDIRDSNGTVTSQAALLTVLQASFSGWQSGYFSTAEIADASISGSDADPNHDGVSNLLSFAFGMDPRGANPLGSMPVAAIVQQSGNRYLTLTYHRLIGVTSIPYKVCVSDDLVTWDETEAQVETVGTPTPTGNGLTETVTVRLKNPISSGTTPRKFMRLNMGASSTITTVFQDNFDDNSIDPTKWTTSGNTVIEAGGIMQVLETVIDQWGVLTSKSIPINPSGTITINRNVYLHDQTYSYGGGTHFFGANTGLQFGTLPPVVIRYFNLDYEAPPNYKAMHGFYICRNGAAPHNPNYAGYDPNDVSSWISPIWATWFKETIVYNPQTGNLAYSINDVLQTTFNVGIMPVTASPSLVLYFDPIGWWMGHEHLMDNLQITQESQSH